jgi:hypothetical protein
LNGVYIVASKNFHLPLVVSVFILLLSFLEVLEVIDLIPSDINNAVIVIPGIVLVLLFGSLDAKRAASGSAQLKEEEVRIPPHIGYKVDRIYVPLFVLETHYGTFSLEAVQLLLHRIDSSAVCRAEDEISEDMLAWLVTTGSVTIRNRMIYKINKDNSWSIFYNSFKKNVEGGQAILIEKEDVG